MKKQDKTQDKKPDLNPNPIKIKELTLEDLTFVSGGGGEDPKNKHEN